MESVDVRSRAASKRTNEPTDVPKEHEVDVLSHLPRHAVRPLFIRRQVVGVEQAVLAGVGEAAYELRAGGYAGGTLEGAVFAWHRGAVFFDCREVCVHGVPDVVLR